MRHMAFARTHFLVPEFQRKNIDALGRNIIICGSGTKKPRRLDTTSGRQNPGLHYWTLGTSTRIIESTEYLAHWNLCCLLLYQFLYFTIHGERKVSSHKITMWKWSFVSGSCKYAGTPFCSLFLVLFTEDTGFRRNESLNFSRPQM